MPLNASYSVNYRAAANCMHFCR